MKNLFLLFVITAILFACGKDPVPPAPPVPPPPPPPPVVTVFTVTGAKIVVKGEMKPGAKPTLAEVKAAVATAVKQLESNGKK